MPGQLATELDVPPQRAPQRRERDLRWQKPAMRAQPFLIRLAHNLCEPQRTEAVVPMWVGMAVGVGVRTRAVWQRSFLSGGLVGRRGLAGELAGDAGDRVVEARVLVGAPVGDERLQGLARRVDQALGDGLAAVGERGGRRRARVR